MTANNHGFELIKDTESAEYNTRARIYGHGATGAGK